MSPPETLERALADLVFGEAIDAEDPAAVRRWLERNEVSADDAEHFTTTGVSRLLVYRSLVRANLRDTVELAAPRTVARLGPIFDEWFAKFLAERGPRTRYLRDVTRELLDWCEPLWPEDPRVPPWTIDLARHESLHVQIAAMEAPSAGSELGELALDERIDFTEAARVVRYRYRVHELPDDPEDRTEPAPGPTALFVYRSPEHLVRYLELTPLAADILEALVHRRATLREAVVGTAEAAGASLDDVVLGGTAELLADLAERGALLGRARQDCVD